MNNVNRPRHMTTEQKRVALKALADKRKAAKWDGYQNIGDFDGGSYDRDHDHVSPITKSADNVDSEIMVMLLDWSSAKDMETPYDPSVLEHKLGYPPTSRTFLNLKQRLHDNFSGKRLADVYATNLFPFIKPGDDHSASISPEALLRAAREYAVPQIEIVQPRLVIALGVDAFWAISKELGIENPAVDLKAAMKQPVEGEGYQVWCQAHTRSDASAMGNTDNVNVAWAKMTDWYMRNMGGSAA